MSMNRRNLIRGGLALGVTTLPLARAVAANGGVYVNRIMLAENRVWIAAMIEGKGPYFFAIDTGAEMSLIKDGLAKQLRLESRHGQPGRGLGGGVIDYSWYVAREVSLASGIRFPEMVFAGTRNDAFGNDLVGVFGAGFLTSYDSDLDFVKGEWRAYLHGRPSFDGLTPLPSRWDNEWTVPRMFVQVSVDGFQDWFHVDTGAPGTLLLYGNVAKRSGLWDDSRPYAPVESRGIGENRVPSRIVRARKLKLGPYVLENQLVKIAAPGTDSFASAGLLGLEALGKFNLSTRVSDGSLWAAPNGLPQRPTGYPLSGLWLDDAKGRAIVRDVGAGSPAAAAGVRKGDVLLGSDFRTMIDAVGGPPGKPVALKIARGGVQLDLGYTLAPWL